MTIFEKQQKITIMKKALLFVFLLSFLNIDAQSIDQVNPNFGDAGQVVSVTINGTNSNFSTSGYFEFYQGSNYLNFPYNPNIVSGNEATGDIDLTNFQVGTSTTTGGFFNLRYTQGSSYFLNLNNAFFVNTPLGGLSTISGTIVLGTPKTLSEEGDPVIYAKIFLVNNITQEVVAVNRTNTSGFVEFLNIPNGSYSLHINDFENTNPFPITVNSETDNTNLSLQYKDDHILSIENKQLFIEEFDFKLYPTIVSNTLTLSMNLSVVKNIEIQVFDINGQLVTSLEAQHKIGKIKIDLSENFNSLTKGVYFLKTTIDNKSLNSKLIKR